MKNPIEYAESNEGLLVKTFRMPKNNRVAYQFECKNGHVFEVTKIRVEYRKNFCNFCPTPEEEYGDSTQKGDIIELYVMELLQSQGYSVSRPSVQGDIFDLVVNGKYGIQVKTLVFNAQYKNGNTRYKAKITSHKGDYPTDTLIVMVNKEKERFCLQFAQDATRFNHFFKDKAKDTNESHYYDEETFITNLNKFVPKCVDVRTITLAERYSRTALIEYHSWNRIKDWCKLNGFEFRPSDSAASVVDFTINGVKFQHKYTSRRHGQGFHGKLHKSAGKNNKNPYEVDDPIDYFLIECGGFLNEFCVISKQELIERGFIKTPTQNGRISITIFHTSCPTKGNFTKDAKYWNLNKILDR